MTTGVSSPVTDSLEITVNREQPNVVEIPETFTSERDFSIDITNEGKPVHMHINCDDDLARGLVVETGNHFIPRHSAYQIPVRIKEDERPFHGKCKVSIGYGAQTKYVEIRVPEPSHDHRVTVDESLAQPPIRRDPEPSIADYLGDVSMVGIGVLGLLGVLLGAFILGTLTTPMVGVLTVIVVLLVGTGIYLLLEDA